LDLRGKRPVTNDQAAVCIPCPRAAAGTTSCGGQTQGRERRPNEKFSGFAGRVVVAFVVTSFVVGTFSYALLTKPLFKDPSSVIRRVYRTPADTELWSQAGVWAFPVQAMRSFLYAIVLFPFYAALAQLPFWRRFLVLSGLFVVLSVFASDGGILESLYMARPEFVTPSVLARTIPEPVTRGVIFSGWIARWAFPKS
jgi:hypothetical protein